MSDDLTMDSGALIFATLADVYLSSGMVDEAISILKDGLSRNPTYSLAKVILGRAYYIKGDIDLALKSLEGDYDELKDSENTNLYLGHCYRKLGDYEKAAEYYNIAIKINPDNKDAKQGLEAMGIGAKEESVEKPPEAAEIPKPGKAKVEEVSTPIAPKEPVVGVALPVDFHEPTKPDIEQPEIVEKEITEMVTETPVAEETVTSETESAIETPVDSVTEPVAKKAEKPEPVIVPEYIAKPEPAKVEEAESDTPEETIGPEPAGKVEPTKPMEETEPVVVEEPSKAVEPEIEAQKEAVIDLGPVTEEIHKTPEPEAVFPLEALDEPMKRLLNIKTVKGAFICSKDGLLIQNYYAECTDIEEISAMIAAIYNEAQEAFKFLKEGSVEKFIVDKIEYPICVITAGESLLTVVTKPEAKPGLVFVYARKIIEEIREILG